MTKKPKTKLPKFVMIRALINSRKKALDLEFKIGHIKKCYEQDANSAMIGIAKWCS